MLTCSACGHKNTAQSNFCSHCGERLQTPERNAETTSIIPVIVDDAGSAELGARDEAAVADLRPGTALLIVRRGTGDMRYLLDGPTTVVGRHPDADIFLDDITVSRHHARFDLTEQTLSITDLGSLNGTYVNRDLVDGTAALRTGDEVQIGKFRMVVFLATRG